MVRFFFITKWSQITCFQHKPSFSQLNLGSLNTLKTFLKTFDTFLSSYKPVKDKIWIEKIVPFLIDQPPHLYTIYSKNMIFWKKLKIYWLLRASKSSRTCQMSSKIFLTCSGAPNELGSSLVCAKNNYLGSILWLKKSYHFLSITPPPYPFRIYSNYVKFWPKLHIFWLLRASKSSKTYWISPKTFLTCSGTSNWLGSNLVCAANN